MNFINMVYYKIKILVSNRLILIFLLLMPLVTAYISGYSSKIEELNIIPIGIVDEDFSLSTKLFLERASKNDGIKIYNVDLKTAQNYLKNSKIELYFVLSKGFEENIKHLAIGGLIKVATHSSSPNSEFIKEIIGSDFNRLYTTYYTYEAVKSTYEARVVTPESDLFEKVGSQVEGYWNPPLMSYNFSWSKDVSLPSMENTSVNVAPVSKAIALNPNNTYHGTILLFVMLFVMFGSTWVTEERNNQILLRLHSTKKGFLINFFANKVALLFCGLTLQVVISILIKIIFGLNVLGSKKALIIYFLYTLLSVSLGLFLGSIFKSPLTLQSIAAPLTFILSFVGGCFFNLSELTQNARKLTLITPQGWALKGLNDDFILSIVVLFFVGILFSFSAYIVLKWQSIKVYIR